MERQKVGEFSFSYKELDEGKDYSLWVEDCVYLFDKETAQEFVNHMREQWPDLEYGEKEILYLIKKMTQAM